MSSIALCSLSALSTPVAADFWLYRWEPIPEASYYRGSFESNGSRFQFQTSENQAMIPSNSGVEVSGMTSEGNSIEVEDYQLQSQPVKVLQSSSRIEEPAGSFDDYEDDYEDYDAEEAAPSATQDAPPVDAPPPPPQRSIILDVGIGYERLTAAGGFSRFDGGAFTGGLYAYGRYQQPDPKDWSYHGHLFAHNFTITEKQDVSVGDAEDSAGKKSYLRVNLTGGARRQMSWAPSWLSSSQFGVGATLVTLPLMSVDDATTGTGTLKSKPMFGPSLSLDMSDWEIGQSSFGGEFYLIPIAFGSGSYGYGAFSKLFLRFISKNNLILEGSALPRFMAIYGSAGCPDSDQCQERAETVSSSLQFRVGAGLIF